MIERQRVDSLEARIARLEAVRTVQRDIVRLRAEIAALTIEEAILVAERRWLLTEDGDR